MLIYRNNCELIEALFENISFEYKKVNILKIHNTF